MPQSSLYDRLLLIQQLDTVDEWDIIVIGGGATGLGVALDAASRGLKVVLFEQHDFAKGTSSRSTKLIHGGVRYLAQGDIKLVYAALHERDILVKNAPHVVTKQSFIIPCYSFWDIVKYSVGLRLYDILAGGFGFGWSRFVGRKMLQKRMPNVKTKGLKGGVEYFDGQFDDARLAINIAQTAIEKGAVVLNYFGVEELVKEHGGITGVKVVDGESQKQYLIRGKCVINATGVFVDEILKKDNAASVKTVRPSQGVHVVVDKKFLNSDSALLIPKTRDGRVLFVVPWQDHLIVGTTDTPLTEHSLEPVAQEQEIGFIIETVNKYLQTPIERKDAQSVFAGLRPLAASSGQAVATKELSRDHKLFLSHSGLVTITGGKWTTYRKMAEETVDVALRTARLPHVKSTTTETALHGRRPQSNSRLSAYGTDEDLLIQLIGQQPTTTEILVNGQAYTKAEVIWAVRNEMARTVEDVLARRLRLLFLDAQSAIGAAPAVAEVMAKELDWSEDKKKEQLEDFYKIAYHYNINR